MTRPSSGGGAPRKLAAFALVGSLLACAGSKPPPLDTTPSAPDEEPWPRLRIGDLEGAERILERWRAQSDKRTLAIAGQLRIASITRDAQRIEQLLGAVPPGAPHALRALAAAAAMVDARLTGAEREVVERACPASGASSTPVVQTICAQAALFQGHDAIMTCREGCDGQQSKPLLTAGALPVVMIEVAGSEPVPFVVDTGAATSLVTTDFAERLGLAPVPGTNHPLGSSGGRVDVPYVLAPLRFGERLSSDVRFAVADLTLPGVAGILSPHDVFREARVTLDFRRYRLELAPPRERPPAETVSLPLLYQARRPHLLVSVGEREPRPLALDTGSDHTRLTTELERLGEELPRAGRSASRSLGGLVPLARTKATVAARAGPLRFELEDPLIFTTLTSGAPFDLGSFGLLGLDFFEGRVVAFDVPAGRLEISPRAELSDWPVGSRQEQVVTGRDFPEPVVVTEQVAAREGDHLHLDVSWSRGDHREHLRLDVVDDAATRRSWLITRPIERAWDMTGDEPTPLSPDEARRRLASLITIFRTTGRGAFEGPAEGAPPCGGLAIPASLGSKPAVARIVTCPSRPWGVERVQLEQDGAILWQLERRAPGEDRAEL